MRRETSGIEVNALYITLNRCSPIARQVQYYGATFSSAGAPCLAVHAAEHYARTLCLNLSALATIVSHSSHANRRRLAAHHICVIQGQDYLSGKEEKGQVLGQKKATAPIAWSFPVSGMEQTASRSERSRDTSNARVQV